MHFDDGVDSLLPPPLQKKKNYQNEKRVLECLQRSLKIADVCMASSMHLQLFVEILNEYLIFFERKCPTITCDFGFSECDLFCRSVLLGMRVCQLG